MQRIALLPLVGLVFLGLTLWLGSRAEATDYSERDMRRREVAALEKIARSLEKCECR